MKIKDRPEFASKPQAFALRGEETVATAVKTMVERNIGSAVIVDADMKVQGIVTERDILRFVAQDLDPKATPLSSVMSTQMKTASLDDDDMEWLQHMSEERFRHLPIVDDKGRLIGILSQGDFVAQTWEDVHAVHPQEDGGDVQETDDAGRRRAGPLHARDHRHVAVLARVFFSLELRIGAAFPARSPTGPRALDLAPELGGDAQAQPVLGDARFLPGGAEPQQDAAPRPNR